MTNADSAQIPSAKVLGQQLIERITSIPDYTPELTTLITLLCLRIDHGDGRANRELWYLAKGLNYGGVFSAGNLDRLKMQLRVLPGGDQ